MKKYCTSCGKLAEFSVKDKPKFCAGCGKPFDLGGNLSTKEKGNLEPAKEEALQEEREESTSGYSGNLSKLDVDIIPSKPPSETLGHLIDNPAPNTLSSEPRLDVPQKSREQFLEDFKREAGSLRSK